MAIRTTVATTVGVAVLATIALVISTVLAGRVDGAHQKTQAAMENVVREGAPGVVAAAHDPQGTWSCTAGVGDRKTKAKRLPRDRYRIGSVTKTFVATVMLQLEADGKLDLNDSVDRWLPDVVSGKGNDGRRITLRQLLNHTSGIYDYTADPDFSKNTYESGFPQHRYDTWTPRQLVEIAMKYRPRFAPGMSWSYSNTNYTLAGMVIEKVTGRPYGEEIERRILKPLGLRSTSVPHTNPRMPHPSSRAYSALGGDPEKGIHDVAELNPTFAGASGEIISDSEDLQRFLRSLLKGELLPKAQMKEMTKTVPMDKEEPQYRYGLGLTAQELSCGKQVWGHDGGIHGSLTQVAATRDATHSLALNVNDDWTGTAESIVEAEFCG